MDAAIKYQGGLTCAMGVSDFKRSLTWYKDVLGLSEAYRMDELGWAELNTAWKGVTLGLSQVEKVEPKGGITPTFGVANIETARRNLEGKGVKFDGPIHTIEGVVRLTTFFDPDGNKLMFAQTLAAM